MKIKYLFILGVVLVAITLAASIFAAQVSQLVYKSESNCSDFTKNLRFDITGSKDLNLSSEISKLQFALTKEGFTIRQAQLGIFGVDTFLAVIGFQEKYKNDILTPAHLKSGNGYVGPLTRKKLASLYGCKSKNVSTPIKPKVVVLDVKGILLDEHGVSMTFCNLSSGNIPTFPVRVRLNGIIREFDIQSAYTANTCYPASWSYDTWGLSYDSKVMYSTVVSIDPFGYYQEGTLLYPDLENITIPAVQGVHLAVRGLIFKNGIIQATFCNIGTMDLTKFPVNIVLNNMERDFDIAEVHKSGKCYSANWAFDIWGIKYTPGTIYTAVVLVGKGLSEDPEYKNINEFNNAAAISGAL